MEILRTVNLQATSLEMVPPVLNGQFPDLSIPAVDFALATTMHTATGCRIVSPINLRLPPSLSLTAQLV